jgi:hypothetical protein
MGHYDRDHCTEIELYADHGCIEHVPAIFSTWVTGDDLPDLTLEAVMLGKLTLSRSQLCDWLGAAEVARMETVYRPERWEPETPASWNVEAAE